MMRAILALATLVSLVACDGPNERAGARQDEAAANATGSAYNGSGPAERMGETQDRADAAALDAQRARARALEVAGVNEQRQAAVGAGALEEQARAMREAADQRAEALERQAAETGKQLLLN